MKLKTTHEETELSERFHYATMPLSVVEPMMRVPQPPNAYLSQDAESTALKELLKKGYRWVRTDGDICVFEKAVGICSPRLLQESDVFLQKKGAGVLEVNL